MKMAISNVVLQGMLFAWMLIDVQAQVTCSNGVLLYQRSPSNSVRPEVTADRTIEVTTTEVPTSACQRICDGTPSCSSFSVDYSTRTCKIYSVKIPQSKIIQRPGVALFEKICLPNASADRIRRKCGSRMWAVERVTGIAFNSFVSRLLENIENRETCIRACLEETSFECASSTYDDTNRGCALSAEDRHTQPAAISANARSSDYFENKCIDNLIDCQFIPQNNVRVVSVDYLTVARNENECKDDCQKNTAIICRSYSYDVAQNSCSLSSDNSIALLGVDLPTQNGHVYAERQCQHSSVNQFSLSPESLALAGGSSNFPGIATVSSQQFLPSSNTNMNLGFGSQQPLSRTPGFDNFDRRQNPGNLFPQNTGSFNNPVFVQANGQQPFDRGFSGTGSRGFANPQDGFFNNNNQFPNVFPTASDVCTLEKSTGLTVMPDPRSIIPTAGFGRGITVQCALSCRLQGPAQCPAFTVDYLTNQCTVLNRPAETALSTGSTPTQSYFEQVCYSTIYRTCQGRAWSFERMVNTDLRGFDDRIIPSIQSRRDCEEACLKETQFQCLSAEYDGNRFECRLSRESRFTKSFALQQSPNVDYLENQCVLPTSARTGCNAARQQGLAVFYVDALFPQVTNADECKRICRTLPNFTCVAASYIQMNRECQLSNDNTVFPQVDSVLLYSSCLNPVQVAAPNFANIGNTFNNQFPGSFGSSGGFSGGGTNLPGSFGTSGGFSGSGTNFPGSFGTSGGFSGSGTNFPGSFGTSGGFSGSGTNFGGFAMNPLNPNQFQGNFNPAMNTGFTQTPFINPTFPQQNPPFFINSGSPAFGSSNPQFVGITGQTFPNQNPQFISTGSTNFPSGNNPQVFGTGRSSFIPQQNPQFIPQSTFNAQLIPTSGAFNPNSFPSQNFGATGFPSTGQFTPMNPFGVQLFPGGVQQQQFPSGSPSFIVGGRFPSFRQATYIREQQDQQNTRRATNSSRRPSKRVEDDDQSNENLRETKRDDIFIVSVPEDRRRKPIRNAPRFLRADPNATQVRIGSEK